MSDFILNFIYGASINHIEKGGGPNVYFTKKVCNKAVYEGGGVEKSPKMCTCFKEAPLGGLEFWLQKSI